VQPVILNRLISARFLLENSGPRLNRHSDARAVAHAVLISHDAAELALTAFADHLKLGLPDRTEFPKLIEQLKAQSVFSSGFPGDVFFNKLNKVRVAFKHHGVLPDSGSWFDVVDTTLGHLDDASKLVLGTGFSEIDTANLIADTKVKRWIVKAREKKETGDFKEALEMLARALYRSNVLFPSGVQITPGDPNAQQALVLSGYGIDPSAYIVLQQLLPSVSSEALVWNLHATGHEMNWTEENVAFATDALVSLVITLQHARPRPQPLKFEDVFVDVLTINTSSPDVRKISLLSLSEEFAVRDSGVALTDFVVGDTIRGRVSVCYDESGEVLEQDSWSADGAEWLRVDGASSSKYDFRSLFFEALVVKRAHVDISYEEIVRPPIFEGTELKPDVKDFLDNFYDIPE
jgi:hypothetical protein